MKRVQTSLFFVAVMVVLALCGSAWGVESSESIQDIISHWKFDEGQGSIAYDSAGGNDGTVYGATWASGILDGALSFDGNEDYVDCGNDSSLDISDNVTISLWFYSESWALPHGYNGLISKRDDFYLGLDWEIYYDRNHTEIRLYDGSLKTFDNLHVNPSLNTWHHLVVTKNGTAATLYFDGIPQGTDTTSNSWDIGSSVRIGVIGLDRLDCGFNGLIDEVAIYNRALSVEEIQQLYQGVFPDVVSLEIMGPNDVAENFSTSYKAMAYYDDDSTRDVTDSALWVVEPNTAANIDDYGVLTTQDIVRHQSVTILASYTEGDVTFDAEKTIDILAICPIGSALRFDGVDDYVDFSRNIITTTEFTVSAWANHYGSPGGSLPVNAIFQQRDDASQAGYAQSTILLATENPGDYALAIIRSSGGSSILQRLTYPKKNYNEWHHYAMIVDSTDFTFYIDGVEVDRTSNNQAGDYVTSIDYVSIGRHSYRGANRGLFNGAIDEVAIYNRALSAEEIRADMHTRLTGDETNLVGYWDFDEGGGQIAYDLSVSGNDGQLGSTLSPDASDPAWIDSDAPIGICSLYQIATLATDGAVERKTSLIEELLAALAYEWTAYEALEELLESGDYGDLNYGDIVTAKQKIHSATQHEGQQSIGALDKSVEKLKDALSALGYEPEPPVSNQPPNVNITGDVREVKAVDIITNGSFETGDFTGWGTKDIASPFYTLDVRVAGTSPWGYGLFLAEPTDGVYAATHGFDGGGPDTIEIFQDVTIPAGHSAILTFDWRAGWDFTFGIPATVRILDLAVEPNGGGNPLSTTNILTADPAVNMVLLDTGPNSDSIDLSAFAGSSIRINFLSTIPDNFSGPAHLQIDNVTLDVEPIKLSVIAAIKIEQAIAKKYEMLEELLASLAEEWAAYEALEEWLENGDYGDLNKGDIVTAKQKIHSATQHGEQSMDALEKSIEKLEDALRALGYEPEPPPPPPGQASNPNPADGATGVSLYADLSWTAGPNAVSHDVYFGMTSPGTFRGNQTATIFDPGTMAMATTYYWRIDEVNAGGTTTGTVWSFITTGGGPR